jgi:hypothetical protein
MNLAGRCPRVTTRGFMLAPVSQAFERAPQLKTQPLILSIKEKI